MEKRFLINIEGEKIETGVPDFYERVQGLALNYQTEHDKSIKAKIAEKLRDLCDPVFQAWRVFDTADREDYQQDCFLILLLTLDSYDQERGNFIGWLKKRCKSRRREAADLKSPVALIGGGREKRTENRVKRLSDHIDIEGHFMFGDQQEQEEIPRTDFAKIEGIIGRERLEIIKMRILDGMDKKEIAKELGLSVPTVHKKLTRSYNALRAGMLLNQENPFDDGSIFITGNQLGGRLGKSVRSLFKMLDDRYANESRYKIHPDDIVLIGAQRKFRYLERGGRLMHPRFVLKKGANPGPPRFYFSAEERKKREEALRLASLE